MDVLLTGWQGPVTGQSAEQSGWRSPHVNLNLYLPPSYALVRRIQLRCRSSSRRPSLHSLRALLIHYFFFLRWESVELVNRIGDSKGIKHRKLAMLWLFLAGLCFNSWSVRLSSMGHFFSDIWYIKNHPHTCPSPPGFLKNRASWKDSWRPFFVNFEKTPGCQERYWYSLHAPRNRSDAHSFLLVQMHHTNSGTVYSLQTILSLRKLCGLTFLLQIVDLSGSARTSRFPCISAAIFEYHTISRIYQSETVRAPFARTYHRELERAWQFDTTW